MLQSNIEGEKQQKYFNLLNGFSFSNTTRIPNIVTNYDYKLKRCKSSKKK